MKWALALLAAVPLWLVEFPPIQDLGNHLGRVHVLADLLTGGQVFGAEYEVALLPLPNLAADVLLLPLVAIFPAAIAGKILLTGIFLLTAYAGFRFLEQQGAPEMGWLALPLLWNTFVHRGFLSFLVSVPLVLLALSYYDRRKERWGARERTIFGLLATGVWFAHLFSFGFLFLYVQISRYRAGGLKRALVPEIGFLPGFLFWVWVTLAEPRGVFWIQYHDVPWKAWLVVNLFRAYHPVVDVLVFSLYAGAVAFAAKEVRRERLPAVGLILLLFLFLPRGAMEGWWVDARALSFLAFFSLAALRAHPARARALGIAMLLVTSVSAAATYLDLGPEIARRIHLASAIPRGASIVPLTEQKPVGEIEVYHHEVTWLVSERDAVTPYLFARRRQHTVRPRRERPAPHEYWFDDRPPLPDFGVLSRSWDYAWLTGDEQLEDELRRNGTLLLGDGRLRVYRLLAR